MAKKILCMGSINIDLVMYMRRMPPPGETVITDNFASFSGGKGGNQAASAASLGGNVKYFTKLGTDVFSDQLTKELVERGVDMSQVKYVEGETAGVAMIWVDGNGQNSIAFTSGGNGKLTPQDVYDNASVFDDCEILLITMEILPETVYAAIKTAKEKGMTVVLDPAPAPSDGIPDEITKMVDFAKPNESEAQILTGIEVKDRESASKALNALIKKDIRTPIITLGGNGALTILDGKEYFIEPIKVDPVDTTAAGDIFLGAFTAALSQDKPLKTCLDFAKAAAAISTTRKGAQTSIPMIDEIEKII